jgi:hypothetical protein
MNKAEKFIEEHTSNRINTIQCYDGDCNPQVIYKPWITPDQARKAVEIAKEEIIDKTLDFLKDKLYDSGYIGIIDLCNEYIKTIKDE